MIITYDSKSVETNSGYIAALLELLITYGRCHTVGQTGNERATHYFKSTAKIRRLAYQLGLQTEICNDAPRGGKLGEYLKVVEKHIKNESIPKDDETKSISIYQI